MQCFNPILPSQHSWSCLPPYSPPSRTSPNNQITDDIAKSDSDKWYAACYTPFHLHCIRDWANRSLVEDRERARVAGNDGEGEWRCPGCQKKREGRVAGYRLVRSIAVSLWLRPSLVNLPVMLTSLRCFCGRQSNPATNTAAPHSCGDSCSRPRATCSHSCPL